MPNPFDTLGQVDYELGFVKKALKKIEKGAKKIEKKVVPKKLNEARRKITNAVKNNKLVQGAVIAAATVYGTPAAGTAVKTAFAAKNVRDSMKQAKAVKTEQKKLTQLVSDPRTAHQARDMESQGFAPSEIVKTFEKKPVKMDRRTAQIKRKEVKAGTQNLQPVVKELEESGFTPQQINNAWVNSEAFKNAAINAAQSEAPAVAANLIASGMPQAQAQSLAPAIVAKQAEAEVEQVRDAAAPSKLPLYLGMGFLAVFLMTRKRG